MAIPKIKTYNISDECSKITNKVSWKPDPDKAVLLIHDMQNYFVNFYDRDAEPMDKVIKNIKLVKAQCKASNIPIIYSAQPGNQSSEERALLTDFWGSGLGADIDLAKIIDELKPEDDDSVYTKWRYSAFQRTDLLKFMRNENRNQLIICGIYAHIGILSTALEAFMSDIKPFVISDAVADFSLADHEMALEYISQRCGMIVDLKELEDTFSSSKPKPYLSLQSIRQDVANSMSLPLDEVLVEDNLMDLGLDSIRIMSLLGEWQKQGTSIRFAELAEAATLKEWWKMIESTLSTSSKMEETTYE